MNRGGLSDGARAVDDRDVTATPTLVLGFDALDFDYVYRFEDSLPNLSALLESGVSAPLTSTHPPWTGSAWPSMYTGVDPSHHGVFDFFTYDGYPDTAELVSRQAVDAPALWDYLTALDRRSVVLNVPVTHPADAIDGVLVPGYLAPEDVPGHPADIREELGDALGTAYRIYSRKEVGPANEEKLQGYLDLIDLRRRAARYLLTHRSWDLAFLQVQKTDAVFHNFDEESAFKRIYEAADAFVGTVREAAPDPVNLLVVSDHGIGPKRGYGIYLNEILRREGYVAVTDSGDAHGASLSQVKESLTGDATTNSTDESDSALRFGTAAQRVLTRLGIAPADIYRTAQKVGLGSTLLSLTSNRLRMELSEGVDWAASTAYARSNAELGIRINLEGRDPDGVVSPSRYDTVVGDLITMLQDVETPDGQPAFESVRRADEVYDGPHLDTGCDILVVPSGMDHVIDTKLYGRAFVETDVYDHEFDGVFIGDGPGFSDGAAVENLSITDVAPIVMALLGEPIPATMTGTVPPKLLRTEPTRKEYGSISFGKGEISDSTDEEVTDRLADLGYL